MMSTESPLVAALPSRFLGSQFEARCFLGCYFPYQLQMAHQKSIRSQDTLQTLA